MAENEIIEVHKSIHDKIVRLQKLLKESMGMTDNSMVRSR